MKTAVRRIVSVGILLILLFAMQRLVMPKYVDDVIEGGFTAEYYREENPHEVLMIGIVSYTKISVRSQCGKIMELQVIFGEVLQQLTWQSYYLLEDALKYETPDVVVFNVLELKYNEPQREEYNRMTLDGMRWSVSKVQAIRASMLPEEHFIDYVFPLLRYHSRVTGLTANDWKYYFKDKTRTTAGYYMRVDTAPYEEGIWEEEEPESDTLGKMQWHIWIKSGCCVKRTIFVCFWSRHQASLRSGMTPGNHRFWNMRPNMIWIISIF